MRRVVQIGGWVALLWLLPAPVCHVAGQSRPAGGFSLETGEACSGLSDEECCGQKLELASLRTQGDYLSRPLKTTVRLACSQAQHVVSPQVCRSIALTRGFSPKDVDAICKPALRECRRDDACRKCVADLAKLDYRGSQNVCHAVTYVPARTRARRVIIVRGGGSADGDTRFQVPVRRAER